ncbi:MAG: hypothetical protein ACK5UV_02475 [bacterium]
MSSLPGDGVTRARWLTSFPSAKSSLRMSATTPRASKTMATTC